MVILSRRPSVRALVAAASAGPGNACSLSTTKSVVGHHLGWASCCNDRLPVRYSSFYRQPAGNACLEFRSCSTVMCPLPSRQLTSSAGPGYCVVMGHLSLCCLNLMVFSHTVKQACSLVHQFCEKHAIFAARNMCTDKQAKTYADRVAAPENHALSSCTSLPKACRTTDSQVPR